MGSVFISYRRKDIDFARALAYALDTRLVGRVFIDLRIDRDNFVHALEYEIKTCDVFVLCVTPNTFDSHRIFQPHDWIRREIVQALQSKKPIALAVCLSNNATFPTADDLPTEIHPILDKQGISFPPDYFDAAVERLAKHIVTISAGFIGLRATSPDGWDDIPRVPRLPDFDEHNSQGLFDRFLNSLLKLKKVFKD